MKKQFKKHWKNPGMRLPTISRVYLITWTARLRSEFDGYRYVYHHWSPKPVLTQYAIFRNTKPHRSNVAKKRKMSKKKVEVKRFRSEARACRVGDPSQKTLCKLPKGKCRLCTAIRTGFKYSLEYKRNRSKRGDPYVCFSGQVLCYADYSIVSFLIMGIVRRGVRFGGGLYMAPSSST